MTRLTVELDEQTLHLLRAEARESAQSVNDLVQAAIAAYVHGLVNLPERIESTEERHLKIRREAAAWRSLPEEERHRYGDKFVAVRGGKVVDSDADRLALLKRVRKQYHNEPILITPAAAESPREFTRLGLRRD